MQPKSGKPPRSARLATTGVELSRAAQVRLAWMDFYRRTQNVALTCRHFGISRQTFYRWRHRYRPLDLTSREERRHCPHRRRPPTWSFLLEEKVLTLRLQFPRWGKDKLAVLLRQPEATVSTSMVGRILTQLSFTDPLTEIYNRRSLEELAGRFIGQAKRLGNPLTFLLLDLDRFKQVNTRFGHLTGDFVLNEIATLLKSSIRGTDAAIRYGGDEFLIALANTNAAGAATVVTRIQAFLDDWNESSSLDDFTVSLSIGMAEWTDGKTLDDVLDLADQHMYEEKSHRAPLSEAGQGTGGSNMQPQE